MLASPATAAWPERPVHLLLGFAAGGGTDTLARLLAARLSQQWGQPVIVENRTGAEGTIAEAQVARAAPDGNTLVLVPNSHTISAARMALSYDPVKDFAPVILVVQAPDLLVINPKAINVSTAAELVAMAKANPGKITFGSPGPSSPNFLETAIFMQRAGIRMLSVPYKSGVAGMVVGLLGGEIQVMFASAAATGGQIKAGQFKALGVAGSFRVPTFPDLPTLAEAADIPGFAEATWDGILAPAGTPRDVILKINHDIGALLQTDELKAILAAQNFFPVGGTPEDFAAFLEKDLAKLKDLAKTLDTKE